MEADSISGMDGVIMEDYGGILGMTGARGAGGEGGAGGGVCWEAKM